jgi:plasmid replication initiation protein
MIGRVRREPMLDRLFAEPIVQQLMRRDRTDEATIRRMFQWAATNRAARELRFTQSPSRAEGDPTRPWSRPLCRDSRE